MKMRFVWATACAAALVLAGCSTGTDAGQGSGQNAVTEMTGQGAAEAIKTLGLSESDPEGLVEGLEALPVGDRPEGLSVSVLPTEVRIQPGTAQERTLPLQQGQFYLSIAPYKTQTHPCEFHVPTSCVGEMSATPVELRITDVATGELVTELSTQTQDNGFVGIWLPRDGEFRVEITADGATGEQLVRTGANDPTCLTTLQLKA